MKTIQKFLFLSLLFCADLGFSRSSDDLSKPYFSQNWTVGIGRDFVSIDQGTTPDHSVLFSYEFKALPYISFRSALLSSGAYSDENWEQGFFGHSTMIYGGGRIYFFRNAFLGVLAGYQFSENDGSLVHVMEYGYRFQPFQKRNLFAEMSLESFNTVCENKDWDLSFAFGSSFGAQQIAENPLGISEDSKLKSGDREAVLNLNFGMEGAFFLSALSEGANVDEMLAVKAHSFSLSLDWFRSVKWAFSGAVNYHYSQNALSEDDPTDTRKFVSLSAGLKRFNQKLWYLSSGLSAYYSYPDALIEHEGIERMKGFGIYFEAGKRFRLAVNRFFEIGVLAMVPQSASVELKFAYGQRI